MLWNHQATYVDKTSDCNHSKLSDYELVGIYDICGCDQMLSYQY
jgi:hypothetical protein